MDLRKCKRCLLYEIAESDAYESVKNYIDSLDPGQKVNDTEYKTRLAKCRECDMLLAGMCRKCGCYVEVRAIRRDSHCPGTKPEW